MNSYFIQLIEEALSIEDLRNLAKSFYGQCWAEEVRAVFRSRWKKVLGFEKYGIYS
ncbi:MAG TPA: hypothetical protein VLG44_02390 [Chlamydiales bacterium]|nr:hypothetical protein [Chlamydiales bacterium]